MDELQQALDRFVKSMPAPDKVVVEYDKTFSPTFEQRCRLNVYHLIAQWRAHNG